MHREFVYKRILGAYFGPDNILLQIGNEASKKKEEDP